MKKVLLFFAMTCTLAISCTKETLYPKNEITPKTNEEYLERFAEILSKAVYSDEDLRAFLKNEALKQFDNDYDVFFPLTKERKVKEERTFRDYLVEYSSEEDIEEIENNCPLLDILVPSWGIIGAFDVNEWDISFADVSVIIKKDKDSSSVYRRGKIVDNLKTGEFLLTPVLIIKNNERLIANVGTKSSVVEYSFKDAAFDNTTKTKVDHKYYDRYMEAQEDYSDFMPVSEVSNIAVNAYNLFKNNSIACHRDNIYYGMTNEISQGKHNPHISEYIARFRFETLNNDYFFDDEGEAGGMKDYYGLPGSYTRYVYGVSDEALIEKFKYDGNLELSFHICMKNKNGELTTDEKVISVPFKEAFQLTKVHVDFAHKTWVRPDPTYKFTADVSCFSPKWIHTNLELPKWDISEQSAIINIHVIEEDNDATNSRVLSVTGRFSENFSSTVENGEIGNSSSPGSVKVGYGWTNSSEATSTYTVSSKQGSDYLGVAKMYYVHPVIISEATLKGVTGYRIKDFSTGTVRMTIMPRFN